MNMINLTIKSSSTWIWLSILFVQISACDKSDVLTNSTNENSIYEDTSDLYINRIGTKLDRDIEIDQDTVNIDQNDMMISRLDLSLDEIDELGEVFHGLRVVDLLEILGDL